MGNSKGRDNAKKRARRRKKTERLVLAKAKAYDCPPREAAFIVAVERVAGAITKRGIFP